MAFLFSTPFFLLDTVSCEKPLTMRSFGFVFSFRYTRVQPAPSLLVFLGRRRSQGCGGFFPLQKSNIARGNEEVVCRARMTQILAGANPEPLHHRGGF